nr:zinc finger, CCHC-type [Tanacetum cinerariifolium]
MMETILKAYGIWETIVTKDGVATNEKKENTSKAIICQTRPQDILMQVAQYSTAKEVCDSIKVKNLRADLVQKARLQTLRSELKTLRIKPNEKVSNFGGKLSSIMAKFKGLGETLEDKVLVRKLLNSVPKKFLPIVATIEQYQDLDEMSFEESIGRLIAYKERIKSQDTLEANDQDKLLMSSSNNKTYGKWRCKDFNKEGKESMKRKNNPNARRASMSQGTKDKNKLSQDAVFVITGENIRQNPIRGLGYKKYNETANVTVGSQETSDENKALSQPSKTEHVTAKELRLAELDMQIIECEVNNEREKVFSLRKEKERLVNDDNHKRKQLDGLEVIVSALDQLNNNSHSGNLSLELLGDSSRLFKGWDPLIKPADHIYVKSVWKHLLQGDEIDSSYAKLFMEVVLRVVKRSSAKTWQATNPEPLLHFLDIWERLMPHAALEKILDRIVMPKLLAVVNSWDPLLYKWLCSKPDLQEVRYWYLGWKNLIPTNLLSNKHIRVRLNMGLVMMNQAAQGLEVVLPGLRAKISDEKARKKRQSMSEAQQMEDIQAKTG